MKTRIFIVRHAEAEGNLFRRIHGHYESSVTANGMRQIEALKRRFAAEPIDACYASDLIRTRTTAQAVYVPKGLPLRCDPRFREVRLGVWEDVPFGELETEQAEMMGKFNGDPQNWHVEGAEDYETYSSRFLEALEEVARRHAGGTVAIFSHGCVIRSVQQRLFFPPGTGGPGHCDNTGVSLLEYEDGVYRPVYLNDNSHLPEELSTFARQQWWREGGKQADHNLWFRPLDAGEAWYIGCRQEAWESIYGSPLGFAGRAYYQDALHTTAGWKDALCQARLGRKPAGIVQLAPEKGAEEQVGHISFLYLLPEYRGLGLGVQLLGQAVSVYRKLGRNRIRLHVSQQNRRAMAFYQKYGFRTVGTCPGSRGDLLVMEWDVDVRRYLRP